MKHPLPLGLVTAEPNGSMNTTWATTDTSDVTQGTKATADNTTNDTTFRMSERKTIFTISRGREPLQL